MSALPLVESGVEANNFQLGQNRLPSAPNIISCACRQHATLKHSSRFSDFFVGIALRYSWSWLGFQVQSLVTPVSGQPFRSCITRHKMPSNTSKSIWHAQTFQPVSRCHPKSLYLPVLSWYFKIFLHASFGKTNFIAAGDLLALLVARPSAAENKPKTDHIARWIFHWTLFAFQPLQRNRLRAFQETKHLSRRSFEIVSRLI